jgi:arginine decarboxylase
VLVVPVLGQHGHAGELSEPLPQSDDGLVQRMLAALEEARNADDKSASCSRPITMRRKRGKPIRCSARLSRTRTARHARNCIGACREILDGLIAAAPNAAARPGGARALLTDMYLCDFSVFHSMLDHWAIKQLFPMCRCAARRTTGARGRRRPDV